MSYLLSICIPTFNRAELLKNTLTSIYSQKANHSDFEVVISDNCSTDHTEEVVSNFLSKYSNLKYVKHSAPIDGNDNIVYSIKLGSGLFLKVSNDTALFDNESINSILKLIHNNKLNQPIVFFSNIYKRVLNQSGNGFDNFIRINSFLVTSILAIGFWKADFDNLRNIEDSQEYSLPALNMIRKNFELKDSFVVYNKKFFSVQYVKNKGGYNIIDVFVTNYLGKVLRKEFQIRNLNYWTFEFEKIKVLVKFVAPWLKLLRKNNSGFTYSIDGANSKLFKIYYYNPLFYFLVFFFFFYDIKIKFLKD